MRRQGEAHLPPQSLAKLPAFHAAFSLTLSVSAAARLTGCTVPTNVSACSSAAAASTGAAGASARRGSSYAFARLKERSSSMVAAMAPLQSASSGRMEKGSYTWKGQGKG